MKFKIGKIKKIMGSFKKKIIKILYFKLICHIIYFKSDDLEIAKPKKFCHYSKFTFSLLILHQIIHIISEFSFVFRGTLTCLMYQIKFFFSIF